MRKVAKNSLCFDKIQGVLSLNSHWQLNALSILCNDRTWSWWLLYLSYWLCGKMTQKTCFIAKAIIWWSRHSGLLLSLGSLVSHHVPGAYYQKFRHYILQTGTLQLHVLSINWLFLSLFYVSIAQWLIWW